MPWLGTRAQNKPVTRHKPISSKQNLTSDIPLSPVAKWLDRLLLASLFLFAFAAPLSIAVTQGAWLLGGLFWILRFFVPPKARFKPTPLDYALFGFFILTGLAAFLSYEPFVSIGKLRAASLFTIVYLFAQNIESRRVIRLLALTLLAGCAVSVIYTLGQRAIGRGVRVDALKIESPLYVAGVRPGDTLLEIDGQRIEQPDDVANALASGTTLAAVKVYRHEMVPVFKVKRGTLLRGQAATDELGIEAWSKGRDWRAAGFFGHYVTYAEALQLMLALTIALFVSLPMKRGWLGVVMMVAIAAFGYALVLTVTRASWLAFLVATTVILVLGTTRRTILIVGVLAVPLVLAGLFLLRQKRQVAFLDPTDYSTTWRTTVWREGFHLLISKPRHLLVGVGMDSIKAHWRQWGLFDEGRIPIGHMHSNLLEIALERGVPTLIVWLLLLGLYARMLLRLLRRLKDADKTKQVPDMGSALGPWLDRGLVLGALGGLAGFFVSGLVHYNWGDSEVVMIFYFIMGLTLALNSLVNEPARRA